MDREQRFINLVQMTLTWYIVKDRYSDGSGLSARPELELFMACLDEAYFFASKNSEWIERLELDKLAVSYVNNWLNNSPGWKRYPNGG